MAAIFQVVLMLVWFASHYGGNLVIISMGEGARSDPGGTCPPPSIDCPARRGRHLTRDGRGACDRSRRVVQHGAQLTVALFFGSAGFRRVAGGALFGMVLAAGAFFLFR